MLKLFLHTSTSTICRCRSVYLECKISWYNNYTIQYSKSDIKTIYRCSTTCLCFKIQHNTRSHVWLDMYRTWFCSYVSSIRHTRENSRNKTFRFQNSEFLLGVLICFCVFGPSRLEPNVLKLFRACAETFEFQTWSEPFGNESDLNLWVEGTVMIWSVGNLIPSRFDVSSQPWLRRCNPYVLLDLVDPSTSLYPPLFPIHFNYKYSFPSITMAIIFLVKTVGKITFHPWPMRHEIPFITIF